ncbi:MAG: DNA methyltransferase, partial [Ignavibacteriaceae bacterium]|nr:DNA methyltransferase [Ignavibacteriaceae bacterium]
MAKVFHAEIYGTREGKYDWLNKHNINSTKWKKLNPKTEFYLFIPLNGKGLKQYLTYYKVTDIFPVNSVGIVTARDEFVIDFDLGSLKRRINDFVNEKIEDDILRETYKLKDNTGWNLKERRRELRINENINNYYTKIYYRPFDERWIFYNDSLIERSRKTVMRNLLQENLALIISRMTKGEVFKHAQITDKITEVICMSPKTSNNGFVFPLFIYTDKPVKKKAFHSQLMMFEPAAAYQAKQPNIKPELFEELKAKYKKEVTPEEIFYYIYAVLYSNTYRTKYAEFLKMDFPRIPFTNNYNTFIRLGKLGSKLADLHLLKSKDLEIPVAKFPVEGSNKVEKLVYKVETGHPSG